MPAIHFFGFPGWRTLTPPFMPFDLFEAHRSEDFTLTHGRKGCKACLFWGLRRDGSARREAGFGLALGAWHSSFTCQGPESWLYNCCGKLSEEAPGTRKSEWLMAACQGVIRCS